MENNDDCTNISDDYINIMTAAHGSFNPASWSTLTSKGEYTILERLTKIEERLSIIVPDLEKLEKHKVLREAYEKYKMLEKLLGE